MCALFRNSTCTDSKRRKGNLGMLYYIARDDAVLSVSSAVYRNTFKSHYTIRMSNAWRSRNRPLSQMVII